MFLDDNRVYRALAKLKSQFQSLGSFLAKTGGLVAAAGSAVLAPIAGIFKETIGHFDEINKASDRLGATTEAVSGLGYAAEQSGSNLEELETSAKFLQKNISEAGKGSKEASDKFASLGLSASQLANLPLDEQFIAVADALAQIPNPADQTAAALDLLGKAGTRMLPLLKSRGGGLRDLLEEARAVGAVISKEDADRATQAGDAISAALTGIKNAVRAVGAAFLPEIQTIKEWTGYIIEGAGQVRQWIADHRQLVVSVAAGAAALVAGGTVLAGFGVGLSAIGTIVGTVTAAVKILGATVLALTSPLGLVAAGLAGLGYLWATQTEEGQQFAQNTKVALQETADTVKTTFAGIADAFKAGDLELAFQIALTGLQLEWAKVVRFWTSTWNDFKGIFVDGWAVAVNEIAKILNNMASGAQKVFASLGTVVGNAFRFITEKALDAAIAVAEALDSLDPTDSLKGAIEKAKQLRDTVNKDARNAADVALVDEVAKIEEKRLAIQNQLNAMLKEEQAIRDKSRAGSLKAAQDDVARLEKQLRDLRQKAADAANAPKAKGNPLFDPIFGNIGAVLSQILKPGALAGAVKGAFATPFAARQFGAGDTVSNRIEKNTAATAENAAKTAENVLSLVNAMRFH